MKTDFFEDHERTSRAREAAGQGDKRAASGPKPGQARRPLPGLGTGLGGNMKLPFPTERKGAAAGSQKYVDRGIHPAPANKINRGGWLLPALLFGTGALIVGVAGFFVWTGTARASLVNEVPTSAPTQPFFSAQAYLPKPTVTMGVPVLASPTDVPASAAPDRPAADAPALPTLPATGEPSLGIEPSPTPGGFSMEIVADTPESQAVPAFDEQASYPDQGNGERWIDVDLSEQRLYAYEGDVVVNSFLVSTGLPATPTVQGRFKIYVKVRMQDMSGPGYYLRDVPFVMFFYDEYGLHGTYWHNNFGTPMSRGCVNLRVEDAEWLYNWASVGTVVEVHN